MDYWKESWIPGLIDRCLKNVEQKGSHLAVINCHQETADRHWDKLDLFLEEISRQSNAQIAYTTNSQVAKARLSA